MWAIDHTALLLTIQHFGFVTKTVLREDHNLRILSGRTHVPLAKKLSQYANIPYVPVAISNYSDQELNIQITKPLDSNAVVIIQSTYPPVNDHLMELLLLADAAKRAGATQITAIMPYFGYSRQNRSSSDSAHCTPIAAHLAVTLLEAAGIQQIITLDLHDSSLLDFFKISIQNVNTASLFSDIFHPMHATTQCVAVSPDIGSLMRTRQFSQQCDLEFAILNKFRDPKGKCHIHDMIGTVDQKHCLLVDDIVDTGETLCKATEFLLSQGALSVEAYITHAVLSGDSVACLQTSPIQQITITDSIPHTDLPYKFRVVPIEYMLYKALNHLQGNHS